MSRQRCIGIVKEVYNKWERRTPLTPAHVQRLVKKGIRVLVEPSDRRVYSNKEFRDVGAELTEDLSDAKVVFGVKQVPIDNLLPDRTYVFFSHTIKGQPANMPMLDAILKKNIRLLDYETITQTGKRNGPRLIAFGGYAGRAGMINTLRGVGEKLLAHGCSTPFLNVGSAYMYPSLENAKEAVHRLGKQITINGLPEQYAPMTFVFTGNGNVSKGAQEIFNLLPHEMVDPADLPHLPRNPNKLYGCIAQEETMVRRINDDQPFSRQEYYNHPERYEGAFHTNVLPYASTIVNCTYWDDRYPRLVTMDQLEHLRTVENNKKLLAVADISCDIGGSVEFLLKDTYIEQPFFLYDTDERKAVDNLDGNGVLMMGVDILPSELPRESSTFFGDKLMDFVVDLVDSDMDKEGADLPDPLMGATITSKGKLTKQFEYIGKMRDEVMRKSSVIMEASAGSTVLDVKGHLFDTNLINQILNLIEERKGRFHVVKCVVRPNLPPLENLTEAHIQISTSGGRPALETIIEEVKALCALFQQADAVVSELPDSYCSGDFSATIADPSGEEAPRYLHDKDGASNSLQGEPLADEVLVLGAGLVAGPAVEYLSRVPSTNVTVVSALAGEATNLVKAVGRTNVQAVTLDAVKDFDQIVERIKKSTVVVSLLPATMHVPTARACIEAKVPLVNASYVSPEMKSLHEEAMEAGVPILCEMGLDPGMDHMSAMKVIDEVQGRGGQVVTFSSICGGLPAPEAANNPLAYKFSWSPRGVLTASGNPAKYLRDGKVIEVAGPDLLKSAEPEYFLPSLALEALPNRDSLPYAAIYGIDDADSVFRGTLRYRGFSDVMYGFRALGLLEDTARPQVTEWNALMEELYPGGKATVRARLDGSSLSEEAKDRTIACLQWLGVWGRAPLASRDSIIDTFCALLEDKLPFAQGERDMVLMHHTFGVKFPGDELITETSTLVAYGDETEGGDTIMARTVGLTVGIGAQLFLNKSIKRAGILLPTTPDIYTPGLEMLEREGIRFVEETLD